MTILQRVRRLRFMKLAALAIMMSTVGVSCGNALKPPDPFTMKIWRSEDTTSDLSAIADQYRAIYPHIEFEFRVFKKEEYERELVDSWARGEGPDIFSVPNARLGKFRKFVSPMPERETLLRATTATKLGKKKTLVEERPTTYPTPFEIRDKFPDVVGSDVIVDEKIYGLPLSIDTMMLFYNRDLLGRAQVAVPPTTWQEFYNAVRVMAKRDDENTLVLPAAAMGTSANVPYAFDILSLLMMQDGANMTNDSGRATFANEVPSDAGDNLPAQRALDFYTKFADENFDSYTWNAQQLNGLEAFTQGNLGFYLGYFRDRAVIEDRAPNLNFSYSKVPQADPDAPVNYATYSIESVAVTSQHAAHAWNFLRFAAMDEEQNDDFLTRTDRIPALKSLIGEAQLDPEKGIVAQQALTAQSWYHGAGPDEAMSAFAEMIDSVHEKIGTLEEITNLAQAKVQQNIQE